MLIYHATAKERRKCSHIETVLNNYEKISPDRSLDFGINHLNSYGLGPYSAADQIMVDRMDLVIDPLRAGLVARNSDLGLVTVEVSMFEEKWKELPSIFDEIKPIINKAYPNDTTIMKYLYVEDRTAFDTGSEETKITMLDGWIVRFATKPLIPTALTIVTTWVGQIKTMVTSKELQKGTVREDRTDVTDLVDALYDAMRKNFGDLYTINSADIRPLLAKYDPTLLKPNAKDSEKLKVNQLNLNITEGAIASEDYNALVPKSKIIADNRKNDFEAVIFLSILTPDTVPDYAQPIPKNSVVEIDTPVAGPKYSKKVNAKFNDPKAVGTIKITIKKIP